MGEKTGDHETLIGFYSDPLINVFLDRCIVLFQRQKTGDLPHGTAFSDFRTNRPHQYSIYIACIFSFHSIFPKSYG